MSTEKAIVTTINYAGLSFEGLMLPDGSYAIAIIQGFNLLKIAKQYKNTSVFFAVTKENSFIIFDLDSCYGDCSGFFYSTTEEDPFVLSNWSKVPLNFDSLLDYLFIKYNLSSSELRKLSFSDSLEMSLYRAFSFSSLLPNTEKTKAGSIKTTEKPGYLYLLELDGCLKMGFSSNLPSRIKNYETYSFKVKLLACRKSTLSEELALHRKLNNGKEKYPLARLPELMNIF